MKTTFILTAALARAFRTRAGNETGPRKNPIATPWRRIMGCFAPMGYEDESGFHYGKVQGANLPG